MKDDWQREIFHNSKYWGKVIAIVDEKIVEYADSYNEIDEKMMQKNLTFSTFKVPKQYDAYRILTFKIKNISKHEWKPIYPVDFILPDGNIKQERMLIDSGADISIINYNFGEELGFKRDEHEIMGFAEGFGSKINFLMRENEIEIDGYRIKNRFAWIQDEEIDDMIIGREVVFDEFDIEFKQVEEKIIFRKR
ncbi:MAG: hypothetical protein HW421_1207 [Ignavibacteria bacterium]|nr:hypothetical protein [Ignavibacteria bacterium]